MSATTVVSFLAVSALVIATPGPDTALTVRNVLFGTTRTGIVTALGVSTGQATWAVATSAGLAELLTASRPAFLALRYAGALYLTVLGSLALWRALRPGRALRAGEGEQSAPRLRTRAAYRQGLFSNLANPKMAAFFVVILPQVAGTAHLGFVALTGFGLLFSLLTLLWLSLYSVVVDWAGSVLLRPRARRAMQSISGAVLVALGVRVAADAG